MKRQFKFDWGTLGSELIENILEKMLLELQDPYLAHQVCKVIHRHRKGIVALSNIPRTGEDSKFHKVLLTMWRERMLSVWDKRQEESPMPEKISTYTRNVMIKDYREALR